MRTLIVEDDLTSRLLLQTILQDYGTTHVAVDGLEAVEAVRLAILSGEPYELICLDIMLPELSGHDALKQIRALEEANGIFAPDNAKVVMVSALNDLKNILVAFHNLCDAYLTKPIAKIHLLEELKNLKLI